MASSDGNVVRIVPAGLSIHVYESAGAPRYGIYER